MRADVNERDTRAHVGPEERLVTRRDRRRRTHAAILSAARQVFAEHGYAKATIRAVAARASCNAALVMQHFGNKQALFRAAASLDVDVAQAFAGLHAERTERLFRHIFERMDANPQSVASTLRSMLTHDDIADEALKLFNSPGPGDLEIEGDDPARQLRRELLRSLALGTAISRYVLKAAAVERATLDELIACLLPAAQALDADSQREDE